LLIDSDTQLAWLGWDTYFQEKFKQHEHKGYVPGRVIADFGAEYLVHDPEGPARA
jgi:hypothetical protein